MMRNLGISMLLAVYLAVTCGVVVNSHYCMNRLASTELFATKSKQCARCGMSIHKSVGCCRDEVKLVKMTGDQQLTAVIGFELLPLEAMPCLPSDFIDAPFYSLIEQRDYQNHSPPLLSQAGSYLFNCVFRI